MSDSLKIILSRVSDAWLLVQSGFKIRTKNWTDFHNHKRFIVYVFDLAPIARSELPELTRNTLDEEDTIWEDRETGTILIVKQSETDSSPKLQVLPSD